MYRNKKGHLIYLCLWLDKQKGTMASFTHQGKTYHEVWAVRRHLYRQTAGHALFVRLNKETQVYDGTAPQFVESLPRDAFRLSDEQAVWLLTLDSHYLPSEIPIALPEEKGA